MTAPPSKEPREKGLAQEAVTGLRQVYAVKVQAAGPLRRAQEVQAQPRGQPAVELRQAAGLVDKPPLVHPGPGPHRRRGYQQYPRPRKLRQAPRILQKYLHPLRHVLRREVRLHQQVVPAEHHRQRIHSARPRQFEGRPAQLVLPVRYAPPVLAALCELHARALRKQAGPAHRLPVAPAQIRARVVAVGVGIPEAQEPHALSPPAPAPAPPRPPSPSRASSRSPPVSPA